MQKQTSTQTNKQARKTKKEATADVYLLSIYIAIWITWILYKEVPHRFVYFADGKCGYLIDDWLMASLDITYVIGSQSCKIAYVFLANLHTLQMSGHHYIRESKYSAHVYEK